MPAQNYKYFIIKRHKAHVYEVKEEEEKDSEEIYLSQYMQSTVSDT